MPDSWVNALAPTIDLPGGIERQEAVATSSGDELSQSRQLGEVHVALPLGKTIEAGHNFFQRGVSCSFAKAKDADAGVGCASANRSERIGGGESQVVVSMKLKFEIERSTQRAKDFMDSEWLHAAEGVCEAETVSTGTGSGFDCRDEKFEVRPA